MASSPSSLPSGTRLRSNLYVGAPQTVRRIARFLAASSTSLATKYIVLQPLDIGRPVVDLRVELFYRTVSSHRSFISSPSVVTEASLHALDGSGTDPYSLLLHTTRTQYIQHRQDVNEQLQQCN